VEVELLRPVCPKRIRKTAPDPQPPVLDLRTAGEKDAGGRRPVLQPRREEKEGKEKREILEGREGVCPPPPSSRPSGLPPASSGGGESEGRSEGALG